MTRLITLALAAFALLAGSSSLRAQTAAAAPEITGKWHFVLDTPGGDRPTDAEFHVDADNKVTGTYGKAPVAGTYADKKLVLSFTIDTDEAGSGTLKLSGVFDSDAITGTWEFTQYNGTFKATRITDAAEKPADK